MNADVDYPTSGCRWCGIERHEHVQRWAAGAGWHKWAQPTQEQFKARMLARRARRMAAATQDRPNQEC